LRRLDLEAVPVSGSGDPQGGYFFCAGSPDPRSLRSLLRLRGRAADWRGVVQMQRVNHPNDVFYWELESWGDNGLYEPPYVFFGDHALLQRVHAELGGGVRRPAGLTVGRRPVFIIRPSFSYSTHDVFTSERV
jgi:hypothetical protein